MIKIAFADFWPAFDIHKNFITEALNQFAEYEVIDLKANEVSGEDIDILFYSSFSNDFLKYDCVRVFYTGENCFPDFNLCDYAIGFEEMSLGDRYLRLPLYATDYKADFKKALNREKLIEEKNLDELGFCSIVVSNGDNADGFRDSIFEALGDYKQVASGGRYKNNINKPDGVEDKLEFASKYKFNLACENVSHPGYCTEKIVQAFAAGTVPIYWGDSEIEKYFNPKAFINLTNCTSMEEAVALVKKIDEDEELYEGMLRQPVIVNKRYSLESFEKEFETFLKNIIDQSRTDRFRRAKFGFTSDYEKYYRDKLEAYKHHADPLYSIAYHRLKDRK